MDKECDKERQGVRERDKGSGLCFAWVYELRKVRNPLPPVSPCDRRR